MLKSQFSCQLEYLRSTGECGCPKRGCPRSQGLRACGAVGSIDHGSIETTSLGWLSRNAFQVCGGGRLLLGISQETVPSEISNPSFSSSLGFEESSESWQRLFRIAKRNQSALFGRPDDAIVSARLNPMAWVRISEFRGGKCLVIRQKLGRAPSGEC
jgi:hypothetical protein